MKNIYIMACVVILYILPNSFAHAQGCVAVRNIAPGAGGFYNEPKSWLLTANYRFFHSYKHFIGTEEQKHRTENKNNVINNDHSLILGANYTLNTKWNFSFAVPLIYIDRSSLYEHYGNTAGNPRFNTNSAGLGDIRISANYKLIDNASLKMQVGMGVKLPTGNYTYKDYFHRRGSQGQDSLVWRVVDQSIQPGDGGFGIQASFDAAYLISERMSLYASGLYLANPRNTNNVERTANLTNDANGNPIRFSNEFSVADQYFARTGVRLSMANGLEASVGGRIECITSHDLIGKEDGFRRPGYIVSADPAVFYKKGNHTFGLNVPVALVRNRTRNTIDIKRGIDTNPNSERFGKPIQGDAAFANFLVSFSYAFRLSKKTETPFGTGSEVVK